MAIAVATHGVTCSIMCLGEKVLVWYRIPYSYSYLYTQHLA